jgi:hypothetical protein
MGHRIGRWTAGVALLGLAAGAAVVLWRRFGPVRAGAAAEAPPEWPPFERLAPAADPPRSWVAPVDGACPAGYQVKANERSGIYHVPGGRFYERTRPDRCYAEAADAEADGYRRAKA